MKNFLQNSNRKLYVIYQTMWIVNFSYSTSKGGEKV